MGIRQSTTSARGHPGPRRRRARTLGHQRGRQVPETGRDASSGQDRLPPEPDRRQITESYVAKNEGGISPGGNRRKRAFLAQAQEPTPRLVGRSSRSCRQRGRELLDLKGGEVQADVPGAHPPHNGGRSRSPTLYEEHPEGDGAPTGPRPGR